MTNRVRAGVLLIGDEILSGRTQDTNLQTIARFLAPLGVQVAEARVVPDEIPVIVAALNALRAANDYVFTTGGIGPTHDDRTAEAVAVAFGVDLIVHPEARALLAAHYGEDGLTEGRLRMARTPAGAALIDNPVSKAPGFQVANVFVLAGVPSIMRGMLEGVAGRIAGGAIVRSVSWRGQGLKESALAADLARLQDEMPDLAFGSYPGAGAVTLVARGEDPARLAAAGQALAALIAAQGAAPEPVEEAGG